jgi:hypothetical protein
MRGKPMSYFKWVLAACIVLLGASLARADSVKVELSRSVLSLAPAREARAPAVPDAMEFGVSSWVPSGFQLPTQIGAAPNYSGAGLPAFYWNYLAGWLGGADLVLKLGVNWAVLSRSAPLEAGGPAVLANQTTYLLSVRGGIEYDPGALRSRFVAPYLSAALLPTAAVSGRSSFDDASVYGGVPVELSIGARAPFQALGIPWRDASLAVGLTQTVGTISRSSVAGFGVSGGAKVSL